MLQLLIIEYVICEIIRLSNLPDAGSYAPPQQQQQQQSPSFPRLRAHGCTVNDLIVIFDNPTSGQIFSVRFLTTANDKASFSCISSPAAQATVVRSKIK
ncbi:Mitochondrial distribution and morphology protein [Dirofilaria immitis]